MNIPKNIFVKSDQNELILVETLPPNKKQSEVMYVYRYTKSSTKLHSTLSVSLKQLGDMLRRQQIAEAPQIPPQND